MRTFKIIIITLLLLGLAGLVLMGLKALIPSSLGPSEAEFDEIYHEDDHSEGDIYSENIKQYEGVVKPLGISIYQEGTHRLEKDDKLIAILESEKVNLPDFEEKEVKVTGVVRDTVEGGQLIMEVRYIEQTKEAGVNAFSDAGYEFSFSYPGEWMTKKEKDKVTFYREKGDEEENIMIVFQYSDLEGSFEDWLGNRDQNLFFEEKQVRVGESNGVRRTISNGDQEIIKTYTSAGDYAYELRLVSQEEVDRNQYFSIVDFFQTSFSGEVNKGANEEGIKEEVMEEKKEDPSTSPASQSSEELSTSGRSGQESGEEKNTGTEEVDEELSISSDGEVLTDLEPLSESEIQKVMEKGFAPFEGRTLSFQYPKVWYFSYLGDGVYGFTDDTSYKAYNEEITQAISRMLIIAGTVDIPCSASIEATAGDTTYTVCTREPGLEGIAEEVAGSIKKPN